MLKFFTENVAANISRGRHTSLGYEYTADRQTHPVLSSLVFCLLFYVRFLPLPFVTVWYTVLLRYFNWLSYPLYSTLSVCLLLGRPCLALLYFLVLCPRLSPHRFSIPPSPRPWNHRRGSSRACCNFPPFFSFSVNIKYYSYTYIL